MAVIPLAKRSASRSHLPVTVTVQIGILFFVGIAGGGQSTLALVRVVVEIIAGQFLTIPFWFRVVSIAVTLREQHQAQGEYQKVAHPILTKRVK